MEINNSLNKLDSYVNKVDGEAAAQAKKTQAAQPVKAAGDVVSLSSSTLKNVVMDEAMRTSDIRAEKVALLKAQVDSGGYTPNSSAIAGKLITEESELL